MKATTVTTSPPPTARPVAGIQSFTGLIPLVLSLPLIIVRLWTLGIAVSLVSTAAVILYHLCRRQGITSLEALSLTFGATNAVLYLGLGNPTLLDHLDSLIINARHLALAVKGVEQCKPKPFRRRSAPSRRGRPPSRWATSSSIRT